MCPAELQQSNESSSTMHSETSSAVRAYFSTALFWIVNALIIIFAWLTMLIVALIIRKKVSVFIQRWGKFWGKALLPTFATQVRVEGLENIPKDVPIIYTPNHQSHLDWIILLAILPLPFRFVIKKELFKVPLFGTLIRNAGYFSLNRMARISSTKTLEGVAQAIKGGESVVIFPEGTRSYDGHLGEFKVGGFLLADKTGAPIIPVAISGSYQIMSRHTWLIRPGPVKVNLGQPIVLKELQETNREDYGGAMDKTRNVIEAMLSELKREDV